MLFSGSYAQIHTHSGEKRERAVMKLTMVPETVSDTSWISADVVVYIYVQVHIYLHLSSGAGVAG